MADINYAKSIINLLQRQREKGIAKYGQILEENTTLSHVQRVEHIEEELIDALMYAEHIKSAIEDGLTANDYQRMAMRTASGMDYSKSGENGLLLNGVMGLNGEAGECIDIMKKHIFQGHELDREHLIEELGDCAWYIAASCEALGVTLEDCLQRNIDKLKARYPEGFDKSRSINRNNEDMWPSEEVIAAIKADCTDQACEDKEKAADSENVHRKTYLEDFLEKYPNAPVVPDGLPTACRAPIYGGHCQRNPSINCEDCWRELMPEEGCT